MVEWQFENGAVQLRTLKIDRTLSLDKLSVLRAEEMKKQGNDLPGFYRTDVGEVCYVVKEGTNRKDLMTIFVPYCREFVSQTKQTIA